jgi:hypothetical protein
MPSNIFVSWQMWALFSAMFASLTAIFAKVGVENVNSDFATFVRTIVILGALALILVGTGQWQPSGLRDAAHVSVSPTIRPGNRRILDLLFSRPQAWRCGARGAH